MNINEFDSVVNHTIRIMANKILPCVYDDALSYQEILIRLAKHLNLTIDEMNKVVQDVINLSTELSSIRDKVNTNTDNITSLLNSSVELMRLVDKNIIDIQEINSTVSQLVSDINNKQDKLTAGAYIDINNNEISVSPKYILNPYELIEHFENMSFKVLERDFTFGNSKKYNKMMFFITLDNSAYNNNSEGRIDVYINGFRVGASGSTYIIVPSTDDKRTTIRIDIDMIDFYAMVDQYSNGNFTFPQSAFLMTNTTRIKTFYDVGDYVINSIKISFINFNFGANCTMDWYGVVYEENK